MAYNQFTLQRVVADFGLTVNTVVDLFPGVRPHPLPPGLRDQLRVWAGWATMVNTEAARTQFLVSPILRELWELAALRVALFAGTRFDVDEAAGLTGVCDFILGRPPQLNYVVAPVLMIIEARNEDMWGGVGQCAAALVAAGRFNAGREDAPGPVYGAVTSGSEWRFLRLTGTALDIGLSDFLIPDADRILGILLDICGVTPAAPAAA